MSLGAGSSKNFSSRALMIFLTVSHPRHVTPAKSGTVIITHRLSKKAWSRYVYQTYGGAKGGKPRSSGRTPDTRTGAPPSPATRASSRWAPSATPGTVCPCASPGRCGIADIPATPVVPPAQTGYILLRKLSAHSRNPSVHQTHDRANFDSSMELNTYVQAGTSRMNLSNSLSTTAPDCTVFGAPTLTSISQKCDGTTPGIEIQWSAVTGASNYEIWRNGVLIYTTTTAGTVFWN